MARPTEQPPQGPPPPRSPFLPPAPPPQPPPADPQLQQRGVAALFLAVLSFVPLLLNGNPRHGTGVALVALAVAVTALLLARSALRSARRAGARRPRGARAGAVIGVIGIVVSGCALISYQAFGPQL